MRSGTFRPVTCGSDPLRDGTFAETRSNEAAQERLDDLEDLVTELHDNFPTVVTSRMQNQIANPL